MPKMDRTERVGLTIPASVVRAIKARAKTEGRTVSNMVTVILKEQMQEFKKESATAPR